MESAYKFWNDVLKAPKFILAPMVDQSELAWRLLARKYGCQVTYSPMFHAKLFVEEESYRTNMLETSSNDHPFIIQFCANDPLIFSKACQLVKESCVAVDLNLGCPQGIARKGHYGAFLQDEWELIGEILRAGVETGIPITAKMRIFPNLEKTLKYAKFLESCGIMLLAVHGRTREQKGHQTGLADWDVIKEIKKHLKIPVIANGNILNHEDILRCLEYTGVDGVMSAEGHLYNPAIFHPTESINCSIFKMAYEYLEIVRDLPKTHLSSIRGHIFKMFIKCLDHHRSYHTKISLASEVDGFISIVKSLEEECNSKCTKESVKNHSICQPYIRDTDEKKKIEKSDFDQINREDVILLRKLKKERRKEVALKKLDQIKKGDVKLGSRNCENCLVNCKSLGCEFNRCKPCCRQLEECKNCKVHFNPKRIKLDEPTKEEE